MDDLQLYIYIALAVIYFIARALRPKKPTQPPMGQSDDDLDQEATPEIPKNERQLTFEELLQEFTGKRSMATTRQVEEVTMPQAEINQDDDEAKSYEEYDDYKTSEYAQYEQQYSSEKELKTIDEIVSIEDPLDKSFENYDIHDDESGQAKKYRKLLCSREGLKDAIILKEILEPKYF